MPMSTSLRSLDIVIPSYNSEPTIQCCLDALVNSIDHCRESGILNLVKIFIVDDGSTDNSPDIIEEFISTSTYPTTLIHQSQQGPSAARNTGTQQGEAPWLLYIDSDVEIEPKSISVLLEYLSMSPNLLALNGYPKYSIPNGSWITQYTNLSLCYQLKQHGTLVNSAFTSLCLMSREAWVSMNGWDTSRKSRYSDDIQSRWYLPNNSIQQCFDALFTHHKHVKLLSLLKHRFNLGFHYLSSLPSLEERSSHLFSHLHSRYPINVVAALFSMLAIIGSFGLPPTYTGYFVVVHGFWITLVLYNNNRLVRFTRVTTNTFQTPIYTLSIFGLSYCEGLAMGLGLLFSFCSNILNRITDDN